MEEMEFVAPVIAGRRITIPKNISEILNIEEGDKVKVKILRVWHKEHSGLSVDRPSSAVAGEDLSDVPVSP